MPSVCRSVQIGSVRARPGPTRGSSAACTAQAKAVSPHRPRCPWLTRDGPLTSHVLSKFSSIFFSRVHLFHHSAILSTTQRTACAGMHTPSHTLAPQSNRGHSTQTSGGSDAPIRASRWVEGHVNLCRATRFPSTRGVYESRTNRDGGWCHLRIHTQTQTQTHGVILFVNISSQNSCSAKRCLCSTRVQMFPFKHRTGAPSGARPAHTTLLPPSGMNPSGMQVLAATARKQRVAAVRTARMTARTHRPRRLCPPCTTCRWRWWRWCLATWDLWSWRGVRASTGL